MEKNKKILEEIARLSTEAKHLQWAIRSPRACPRAAWDAEENLRLNLLKIEGLYEELHTAREL